MTQRPTVLFAHGRAVIGNAATRVLTAHGFEVEQVADGDQVRSALNRRRGPGSELDRPFDALVVDVALPGAPWFELTGPARESGVRVIILVASVFRRTSYKRKPQRLYGADDHVEIHHLGDHLPQRLRAHLGLGQSELPGETVSEVFELLQGTGDQRLSEESPESLADLIVADMLLYNGDLVAEAEDIEHARLAVADDLQGARDLFAQVRPESAGRGLIDMAFRRFVASLDGNREDR